MFSTVTKCWLIWKPWSRLYLLSAFSATKRLSSHDDFLKLLLSSNILLSFNLIFATGRLNAEYHDRLGWYWLYLEVSIFLWCLRQAEWFLIKTSFLNNMQVSFLRSEQKIEWLIRNWLLFRVFWCLLNFSSLFILRCLRKAGWLLILMRAQHDCQVCMPSISLSIATSEMALINR